FLAADPPEFLTRVTSELAEWPERGRKVRPYAVDGDWEAELAARLPVAPPCDAAADIAPIWGDVVARMILQGISAGPMSYLGSNDGDLAMVRAVWRLVRGLKATRVVETGVAHGVTSRFILEAMARNGGGRLWSVDLPPMLHPEVHKEIGVAVDERLRRNW